MAYNPYRKYSSYWWRHWLNLPSDLSSFFARILDYAPLLWEDNDYDFNSILRIMRFKLRRLRKHMKKHDFIAHSEDVVAELAKMDVLLRNVIDEDPDDEWSMHHNQWHMAKKLSEPCSAGEKACQKAITDSMKRNQRNWRNLWRYCEKHAQGWWD